MLEVKMEGLEDLQRRLANIPAELSRLERAAMHEAVIHIRDETRSRVYSPAGRAARGMQAEVQDGPGGLQGLISAKSKAARFSQKGRPPGKAPRIGTVMGIMRRAGTPVTRKEAFLIARAIGRSGTQGRPVMVSALEAARDRAIGFFRDALRAAVDASK